MELGITIKGSHSGRWGGLKEWIGLIWGFDRFWMKFELI